MGRVFDIYEAIRDDAEEWVGEGRLWWPRLPLLLWGLVVLVRVLVDAQTFTPFDWLNLALHEIGHLLFSFFGQFLSIAGGSITQIAAPLASGFMFLRQRDYFAVSFVFCWLAESLLNLSHYIGDAVLEELPLVSLFAGEPIHDWAFLLRRMGLLHYTDFIAGTVRFGAGLSVLTFLFVGSLLVWKIWKHGTGGNVTPDQS